MMLMKGASPVPVAQEIERAAGQQVVDDECARGLAAHQDAVRFPDVLQPRGERPVRHLDGEELEGFLVGGLTML